MNSRLDRLFILLDTGSNESIRLTAAKQLGEVQRVQPNDLNYLLRCIKEYSSKPSWETRVAAGQAVGCVLEHVPLWPPKCTPDKKDVVRQHNAAKIIEEHPKTEQILSQFDLDKIISLFPMLLSIDVTEADDTEPSTSSSRGGGRRTSSSKKNDKEQLMRQRKLINKELGISMVDSLNLGVKSTDIVTNDDLQGPEASKPNPNKIRTQEARSRLHEHFSNYDKLIQNLIHVKCLEETKKPNETSDGSVDTNVWPLASITQQYTDDLFNPSWEIRHGAAIALREILKSQSRSVGKRPDVTDTSNEQLNQLWLVDMALRSICVLALDKFGDFLFDQVVAPVRENAAQLLGCCVSAMTQSNVHGTVKLLLKMLHNRAWEVRHGGIVGLKYCLNVVDDSIARQLLVECFDPMFKLLGDPVDDVSAEAAAALVPVKELLIETIPEKAPQLIKFLWEHLADLDELTTSTSNIVLLLAALVTSSTSELDPVELIKSLPRLWPLLSHTSTTVRISVLKALTTLIKTQRLTCLSWMPEELMTTFIRLIFQRAILENMDEVRSHLEGVWTLLLKVGPDPIRGQEEIVTLLKSSSQYLNYWLCLIMQPFNLPIDRGSPMWLNIKLDGTIPSEKPDGEVYIGSSTFNADTLSQQKNQVTKCRILGTKMVGALYATLTNGQYESQHSAETLRYLSEMFVHYLKTKSANQKLYSGWALESWASHLTPIVGNCDKLRTFLPANLVELLELAIRETNLCYDELASDLTRLQQETREFVASLQKSGIATPSNLPANNDRRTIYNFNQIQSLCDLNLVNELERVSSKKLPTNRSKGDHNATGSDILTSLSGKKNSLVKLLATTSLSQKTLTTSVLSSISCALISWYIIPEKLELLIKPLLDSTELEEDQALQTKSICYLVRLFEILCADRDENHDQISSILDRLIKLLVSKEIPSLDKTGQEIDEVDESGKSRIILLDNLQRKADQGRAAVRRQSSVLSAPAQSLKRSLSSTSSHELENPNNMDDKQDNAPNNQASEICRGVRSALASLAGSFAKNLPINLPQFWASLTKDIVSMIDQQKSDNNRQIESRLITSLLLLQVVGDSVHSELQRELISLLGPIIGLLYSANPLLRHHAAQCIGVISKMAFHETIKLIDGQILPMLELDDNCLARCGSIEAIASIIEHLQLDLIGSIDIFIVHVLKRMSDQNDQVRLMATHCFGKLLSLMPLNLEKRNSAMTMKAESDSKLDQTRRKEHKFVEQLLDPKKLEDFVVPFEMNAQLRSYQQDGLNWLAFLNRYNLHGILCDEMGLGKTFMTISMVASDHYLNRPKIFLPSANDENESTKARPVRLQPSLIICPPTLTEHWLYEIIKFVPKKTRAILNPIVYTGNIYERTRIRNIILNRTSTEELTKSPPVPDINLVVTSYDIVRNDIDFFKSIHWNYCVLDEGHMIKNIKTKLSRSIRLISAKHRLILSGTPIQNNVTELWSLFDFLMPGFLGSERQFYHRYSKPILQSRDPKCSSREQEAGALAMESLHRQVLPFILRRLKEDVLEDLPPKIIQDYYCELSPMQQRLYEDFTRSKLCKDVTRKSLGDLVNKKENNGDQHQQQPAGGVSVGDSSSKSHVFQALQYLKSVCNHPKLVLTPKHSEYVAIKKSLDAEKSSLDDINHSSKLKALKQLLIDCGIGASSQAIASTSTATPACEEQQNLPIESVVNQHRALVFCQVRSMVNIIENDLLKRHLPDITYMKLDGSVPANQRHSIVSRFNNDPSIDILLLTTQIGGLGLNLTGADTVIFVEHDWNPTKDLQAMDRAHRIGQRKVVNVYRLITKSTLEEKIMGLQKFKTMVSNTVINQDNAALRTMNVDQLFDLFSDSGAASGGATTTTTTTGDGAMDSSKMAASSGTASFSSSFEHLLPELWDQQQYETEYDLSSFVSSLK